MNEEYNIIRRQKLTLSILTGDFNFKTNISTERFFDVY